MIEITMDIAEANKERIVKLSAARGLEVIFEKLLEKFGASLGEISIAELNRFRAATIYSYEKVIES